MSFPAEQSSIEIPTMADGSGYIEFMGQQTMVVDPRSQGFGLRAHEGLDVHATKFFVLSGSEGTYISPMEIPEELTNYYDNVGVDVAKRENIVSVGSGSAESSVMERANSDPKAQAVLARRQGSYIVPFMVTSEVEDFASRHGLRRLADAGPVESIGDKAIFQQTMREIAPEIKERTGYDITVRTTPVFAAGNERDARDAYGELSPDGAQDIMLLKPKSASAMGVFTVRAADGVSGLHELIATNFKEGEDVLLEEFVPHNHSATLQGVSFADQGYRHLYLGAQFISNVGSQVQYDGNEIPFGVSTYVRPEDLRRIEAVNEYLGQLVMEPRDIYGIADFDSLLSILPDGTVDTMKFTEVNLHLPGNVAMYAAATKLFPDGFRGVARNWRYSLQDGETPAEFMERRHDLFVQEPNGYGLFPLSINYDDKIDVVAFAPDGDELHRLVESIE
jgi:hypothetical protein